MCGVGALPAKLRAEFANVVFLVLSHLRGNLMSVRSCINRPLVRQTSHSSLDCRCAEIECSDFVVL